MSLATEQMESNVETSGAPLLEVEDLHTHYPISTGVLGALTRAPKKTVRAVDGVSFGLRGGEMLALVGESGCGKTTTAQTVLHLVDKTSGTVRFEGQDLSTLGKKQLRARRLRMQMIYQDPYESLDPRFSVRQTVEEPLLIHHLAKSKTERRAAVVDALERVGLTPPELFLDRYAHELSGGQRQRVAIAAALMLKPKLLVADEPVSMLDVSVRAGILTLLNDLRRDEGMGILMITHDLSTAAHFADRIAVMYLGRIVEHGPARQVIADPQHPYTQALLSVVPKRDPRDRTEPQVLRGETPNPSAIPQGCRFHPRCPVAIEECKSVDPALRPRTPADPAHQAACILVGQTEAE